MKIVVLLPALLGALALPAFAATEPAAPHGALLPEEENAMKVYATALPSVVQVDASWTLPEEPGVSPEFQKFFGQVPGSRKHRVVGTGVVWDDAGHVVTMAPLATTGSTFSILLADGSRRAATLVASDAFWHIAVLKVDGSPAGLHPILRGTSRALSVGQRLYVIGNAYGRINLLSEGMLGGITGGMSADGHANLVLNASINPGNAGGPILDTTARMVGLVEASYGGTREPGYALGLPADDVASAAAALIAHGGPIDHPLLGIDTPSSDSGDLPAGLPPGVPVGAVDAAGPANRAGLLARDGDAIDVITAIDATPVTTLAALRAQLDKHRPGDTCRLDVWRAGTTRQVTVTLDKAKR
jgi:S1-C subfamily serine protease